MKYWLLSGILGWVAGWIVDNLFFRLDGEYRSPEWRFVGWALVLGPVTWIIVLRALYSGIKYWLKGE